MPSFDEIHQVDAVILAGGFGTRLKQVVSDRPKVLADVNGRPFIFSLLDQLSDAGMSRVVLCTGYMSQHIEETLGREYGHLSLEYSTEEQPLGTGGALTKASEMIRGDWILVMNGDSFVDIDFSDFMIWHEKKRAKASIVIVSKENPKRYGIVEINANEEITGFFEKAKYVTNSPEFINAGIYVLHRSLIDELPEKKNISLETGVLPSLIGNKFYGYRSTAKFIDIGTPESYRLAESFLNTPIS